MRITNRMLIDTVLRGLNMGTQQMSKLEEQLAAGKKLLKPSDDPLSLSRSLNLRSILSESEQHLRNIDNGLSWLEASETNVRELADLLQRAQNLALRGGTDTQGEAQVQAMAIEVDQMLKEALWLANAQHGGQYIFGGFKTDTAPFTLTEGEPDTVTYNGDTSLILRQITPTVTVAVNVTGGDTFLDTLNALIALRDDLEAVNISEIASTRLGEIQSALDAIVDLEGQIGARIKGLQFASNRLEDSQIATSYLLSKTEDLDMAEAVLQLAMVENAYTAALKVGSMAIQPGLVAFLK